ncbi:hypothetical protein [Clostridium sp. Ade.TY]|uniref:hypothetical protein n=1 Tax=Clostridium sp. Ade.TY TaxID=1391647 RepID=UPI000415F8E2|nr:hypothetical protein [Clostridium sp. Ade.TY]
MLISMLGFGLLDAILIVIMIIFFIKAIRTFNVSKRENDDEKVREINKKGSKYMLISVILVPFIIFISFIIAIKYIIGI